MNYKIKTKLITSFSVVFLLLLLVVGINTLSIFNANKNISEIKNNINVQVGYSNTIKIDAIQVQQWLTDASLTKSSDSDKEVEGYKNNFLNTVKKLEALKPDLKNKLDKLTTDFNDFYEVGLKMENAYKNQGIEQGNILMNQFDPMTEKITDGVNNLTTESNQLMKSDLDNITLQLKISEIIGMVAGVFALICVVIIVMLLNNQISKPINNLLSILTDIESGEGDLTKRINIKSNDEIGLTAKEFNRFLDKLEKMISDIKVNAMIVSNGSQQLQKGEEVISNGISNIDNYMNKVASDTESINKSMKGITLSVSEISNTSQSTAADAQNISNSAEEINNIANESGKLAMAAKLAMEEIKKYSLESKDVTEELGNKANEIGKIIDTIKAISTQTNLLALNAAIEASRAGEAGRGFGVVAEEIRKLAESNNESAKSTENLVIGIQAMIHKTIDATSNTESNIEKGNTLVQNVYAQMNRIIDGINGINERIQNIAASTQEQSASTEELFATMDSINSSNTQITSAIKEIASGISEQTESSAALSNTAKELSSSAMQLSGVVNKFKIN